MKYIIQITNHQNQGLISAKITRVGPLEINPGAYFGVSLIFRYTSKFT